MKTVQLIVECTCDEKEKLVESLGQVKYRLPLINSFVLEVPEANIDKIHNMKNIKAVYETSKITAQMQAARVTVNADTKAAANLSGKGITIAILDTGISLLDDFVKPQNRVVYFKDFVNSKEEAYDDNCHGTHVWCASSERKKSKFPHNL